MDGEKVVRKILVLTMATMFIFVGVATVVSGSVKAWDISGHYSPGTVTAGTTVTFTEYITNTGSKSMEITGVGLHFDWMDDNYYYWSSDVSQNSPYVLGSGDSASFDITVPIPSGITTHTYHSMTLMIYAADPGIIHEWGTPYSKTYSGSVFVKEPTYTASGYVTDSNTGDGIAGATVSIGSLSATTDYEGYYSIDGVMAGTYTITVEADGYESASKTVSINDDTEVDFSLTSTSSSGGSNGGGGTNNGGSGTNNGNGGTSSGGINNGEQSNGGNGWLIPLIVFVIIIILIVAIVAMKSSKKKETSGTAPPTMLKEMKSGGTKFCPHCGREIPADATICPYCGNKVGEAKNNE